MLNLYYRILQNHWFQPSFSLPNLKLTLSLTKTLPTVLSPLWRASQFRASVPPKVASQRLQVYFWDWRGHEKSEWRRLNFESDFSDASPPHYRVTSPFLTDASLLQITSGQSSGTSSQDASRLAPAAGAVGPSASPSPREDTPRPGACGGDSFCTVRFQSVYLLWSVVFAVQAELVWVFECCCLLFFKGLLALPWGSRSRDSYLCFSPAYRLLTGTKWKNTCS